MWIRANDRKMLINTDSIGCFVVEDTYLGDRCYLEANLSSHGETFIIGSYDSQSEATTQLSIIQAALATGEEVLEL